MRLASTDIVLPTEIASKIYDVEGNTVASINYGIVRTFFIGVSIDNVTSSWTGRIRNVTAENTMQYDSYQSDKSVPAGGDLIVSFEINMSLF